MAFGSSKNIFTSKIVEWYYVISGQKKKKKYNDLSTNCYSLLFFLSVSHFTKWLLTSHIFHMIFDIIWLFFYLHYGQTTIVPEIDFVYIYNVFFASKCIEKFIKYLHLVLIFYLSIFEFEEIKIIHYITCSFYWFKLINIVIITIMLII